MQRGLRRSEMKYKSDILETIHENATANFEIEAISEARMREYDEMCLTKETETVQKVENSGELEHIGLVIA
jgi:DNA-binding transcriptional regulator YiaG